MIDNAEARAILTADTKFRRLPGSPVDKDRDFQIITEVGDAIRLMPKGKRGIVLGSGKHTQAWRKNGWETLDIDARSNPDYVSAAGELGEFVPVQSVDFVLMELLPEPGKYLNQAHTALKVGGILVIFTGNQFPNPNIPKELLKPQPFQKSKFIAYVSSAQYQLPDVDILRQQRRRFIQSLSMHGFKTTKVLGDIQENSRGQVHQSVVYCARRLSAPSQRQGG